MDLRKTAEGNANKINVHVSKSYDGKMRLKAYQNVLFR